MYVGHKSCYNSSFQDRQVFVATGPSAALVFLFGTERFRDIFSRASLIPTNTLKQTRISKVNYKHTCYTSQLEYIFRLQEHVSRALGENSLRKQHLELFTRM